MGLPSQKRTSTSKKQRASHFALKKIALVSCKECGTKLLAHRACPKCGSYKGKKAVNTQKRAARTLRNKKAA